MNGFGAGTVLENVAQREGLMGLPVVSIWTGADDSEEIAGHVAARDGEFEGLVERQSRLMFRVAYSVLRNAQDAEDAVQEAFLKLYRGEAWRQMQDERAFLARTVWRVALDRLPPKAGTMTDVAEMELAASGDSPETRAVDGQERERLRRLIEGLPKELRQVLVLSAIEKMRSPDVAKVIGIPEGTVRTRLMRAKLELKKRFEGEKR